MSSTLNTFLSLLQVQVLQVTVLILIVGLVSLLLRNRRPHLVFALWAVVFVKCLTPPVMVTPLGLFAWQTAPASAPSEPINFTPVIGQYSGSTADVAAEATAKPCQPASCQTGQPAAPATGHPSTGSANPLLAGRDSVSGEHSESIAAGGTGPLLAGIGSLARTLTRPLSLFLIWLTGVLVLLGLVVTQWVRCWLAIRHSRVETSAALANMVDRVKRQLQFRRPVQVIVTGSGYGPMVFGYLRPVLVLPEQIVNNQSRRELEPVIAHELIHVRRGDTLLGLLQFLAQTLLWFNPLVWWASRQTNRVCERCCDLEVVDGLQCQPVEYARTLLGILELRRSLFGIAAAAGIRPVDITANRLRWLVSRRGGLPRPWLNWLVATFAALMVYPGAGLHHPQEHPDVQTTPRETKLSLAQQGDRAFAKQDWETAAKVYRQIVEANETHGGAWFRLGYALHALGRLDEAIHAHQRASEFPRGRRTALYNWACALSLQGNHDEALAKLEESIEAGLLLRRPMEEDPDFAAIKDDQRFLELVERQKKVAAEFAESSGGNTFPTLGLFMAEDSPGQQASSSSLSPELLEQQTQMDFWIGRWDVADSDGKPVGTSVMRQQDNGHMLHQVWTARDGKTGQSINYFDPDTNQWVHKWMDSDGAIIQVTGTVNKSKAVQMSGKATFKDGGTAQCRMNLKLLGDGRLHHKLMISKDDGQSWETRIEGFHTRATGE